MVQRESSGDLWGTFALFLFLLVGGMAIIRWCSEYATWQVWALLGVIGVAIVMLVTALSKSLR